MSISEPFRYRNDSFQSDIFDTGITDVDARMSDITDIKVDVDAHLCRGDTVFARFLQHCMKRRVRVSLKVLSHQILKSFLSSTILNQ